jgi:hypothetical protein
MKRRLLVFIGILTMLLMISVYFNITAAAEATPEPGSDQDPIVSKSYVDSSIAAYAQELDSVRSQNANLLNRISLQEQTIKALQSELDKLKSTGGVSSTAKGFEAVTVKAGQTLLTGSGTELVLRSGKAAVIKGTKGSLMDVNTAKELASGAALAINHLNLSTFEDGQGLKATTQCVLMVRGSYKLGTAPSAPQNPQNEPGTSSQGTGIVNTAVLNIRSQANTTSAILAKVSKGESLTILSKSGDWYRVKTAKGVTGWALGTYVTVK